MRSGAATGAVRAWKAHVRIVSLRDHHRVTVLLVEHDLDVVMRASDRVVVMSNGAVIAEGTPEEVRADAAVVDAYLGTARG